MPQCSLDTISNKIISEWCKQTGVVLSFEQGILLSRLIANAYLEGLSSLEDAVERERLQILSEFKTVSDAYIEELPENHQSFVKPALGNILRRLRMNVKTWS